MRYRTSMKSKHTEFTLRDYSNYPLKFGNAIITKVDYA